ncbi:site-specific integrase [Mucilaginibacter yixingensis]|nr:site-specific integrase [Mucilaginibacter yixingensis]
MYTEPKIVSTEDLSIRAYVTFYLNNKRVREYNGKTLGLRLNPNRAVSADERNLLLKKLQFELHKALDAGTYKTEISIPSSERFLSITQEHETPSQIHHKSTAEVLLLALNRKLNNDLSRKYKRNLRFIHRDFVAFLSEAELNQPLNKLTTSRIDDFLSRFNSSGTYYMNKRRDLGVLLNAAGRMIDYDVLVVKNSERRRTKAKLNKAYRKEQLKPLLTHLKKASPNLYLCCLLTYSTWLRPHEEIRLLTLGDFSRSCSEIRLSGDANKGGKVRTVFVPLYVREELNLTLKKLKPSENIFTGHVHPFNEDYFKTQWGRLKDDLIKLALIEQDQTIYSFRHTAAIEVYRKTKDVHLLQNLLAHSTLVVTLKYLRSLGELSHQDRETAAPTL